MIQSLLAELCHILGQLPKNIKDRAEIPDLPDARANELLQNGIRQAGEHFQIDLSGCTAQRALEEIDLCIRHRGAPRNHFFCDASNFDAAFKAIDRRR